jgi:hypothetical protein
MMYTTKSPALARFDRKTAYKLAQRLEPQNPYYVLDMLELACTATPGGQPRVAFAQPE